MTAPPHERRPRLNPAPLQNDKPVNSGWFKPGNKENPSGKPKGARNRVLRALDELGASRCYNVWLRCLEFAEAGNVKCMQLVLDRCYPARKGAPVMIDIPAITVSADIVTALSAIVAAMGRGDVSPDEAALCATVLETQRAAVSTHSIEAEITRMKVELESRHGKRH
jgi:hypothetical protein